MFYGGAKGIQRGEKMSKRHLWYIAQSNFFIKGTLIIGDKANIWRQKRCLDCGNYPETNCNFYFDLGSTVKCYNWYKKWGWERS